jgi:hypothetical protein
MKNTKHILEYEEFDDLDSLKKDMQGLSLSLSDDEQDMLDLIKFLGHEELTPYEFADYLYDYANNPEDYGIDRDSEEFEIIEYFMEDVSACARYSLTGPMKYGDYKRWDTNCILKSDVYQLYLRMLKHPRSR